MEFARWYESADRTLARTELPGVVVSTVFLGIDHRYGEAPPVLWETMIFAEEGSTAVDFDEEQARYTSKDDALAGHRAMVAKLNVN